ncbi:MAG: Sec-independent protein translocase protein TatB [Steroidobacteraceae bacterium]
MFEVGFQELALIFGVALVVLGPTRLPGLVTKIGRWVGKARSMAREFRSQLESEINLEEMNRMTDIRSKDSGAPTASTPPIPPEMGGQPLDPALTNYPYGAPDAPATTTTDDTYSHAHAEGEAPMPYAPESTEVATTEPAADSPAPADLPPDDARRNA